MHTPRRPSRAPGLKAAALAVCCALSPAARAATPPLAPPQQFLVRGTGYATLSGSHCCGDTRFNGRFETAYEIDPSGAVRLASLRLDLDDVDVVVRDGFLGLFDRHVRVRCGNGASATAAGGRQADATHLKFAPGSLSVAGVASEERLADGSCADPTLTWAGVNDSETLLLHDPVAGVFGLAGTFHTTIEGEAGTLTLQLSGLFVNRPPAAALALRRTGEPYPQSGCPAFWRWNGQLWEQVAEANDPAGLKGDARSYSSDPDGGWPEGDVATEDWFLTSGSGARAFLTAGRDSGPLAFGFGPTHRLELLAGDHLGAVGSTACSFRVVDTTPPTVRPPAPLVLGCSTTGGATPSTSAALRGFLAGATAIDASDPAPASLTPRLGSADVTDATLFPADGAARVVAFRFQDRWGNLGQATANVTVKDSSPPTASATATPSFLAPDMKFWAITVTLAATDDCGRPVAWKLLSIASNAAGYDAGDILGAADGADDRAFSLFSRLAAPGVKRVYTITYEAKDAAGNAALVKTKVTVG